MQYSTILRHHWVRLTGILVVLCGLLAGCASQTARNTTLFTDLGGRDGVYELVDAFLYNLADDNRINPFFAELDILRFRQRLFEQFCTLGNGPCDYAGSMRRSHAGLHIDDADFNALVDDLIDAMEEMQIRTGTQNRLLAKLAPMYSNIVEN